MLGLMYILGYYAVSKGRVVTREYQITGRY